MIMLRYLLLVFLIALYSCGSGGSGNTSLPSQNTTTDTTTVSTSTTSTSASSIEYISADPASIGIKGSGQTEYSTIKFLVKDTSGEAVADGTTVDFTMEGPSGGKMPSEGGEYIGDSDSTPTEASAGTASGYVSVILHSGKVSGTVTITATVSGTSISATSSTISIGGGVASAGHFNLATSRFNLPGLVKSNSQATITAYIADRFGNYNLLEGTSVSFYTEAGAIDSSATTDSTGIAYVTFRTQAPNPADVALENWESSLINSLNSTYSLSIPTDGSVHPRDGWLTVLATVQGEEAFDDANGNGMYDSGESFTDLGEPFIDKDDDGVRDSSNPYEDYIDSNGNGQYDAANGVWDGPNCPSSGCLTSKTIWTSITLAFTGNSAYCAITPTTFALENAGEQLFSFMLGDINVNRLVSGTTISVTTTKGKLSGTTSYTVADAVPQGPTEISFTIADDDSSTWWDAGQASTITVTVSSSEVVVCEPVTVSGTMK